MKPSSLGILVWLAAFSLLLLAESFLGLEAILLWMALTLYAMILALVRLIVAVKRKQLSALYRVSPVIVALTLAFFTPLRLVSPYLRLWVEERDYMAAIESAVAGNRASCERLHCIVEDADRRQIAFVWAGIIDNWQGICHDPTATVLKSNLLKDDWSNQNDPEYLRAAGMFGGTMTGAVHLWGDWYLCRFT